MTITAHDDGEVPVANVTVNGSWSDGAAGSCVTDGSGQCSLTNGNINRRTGSVTFTVDSLTHASFSYASGDNHDPDGDSNGTAITIFAP